MAYVIPENTFSETHKRDSKQLSYIKNIGKIGNCTYTLEEMKDNHL